MGLPYCDRFGFDEANIKQRLALLDLRDSDRSLAGRLQQAVMRPDLLRLARNPEE